MCSSSLAGPPFFLSAFLLFQDQAIGRAWRMGQQRAVQVKRFYVKVSKCEMKSVIMFIF
jgi:hypothetical protein